MNTFVRLVPVLLLVACSSMPLITEEDFATKEKQGDLESFYSQLQSDLKLAKPESEAAENRQMYVLKVGRKIAEQKEQQLFDGLGRGLDQHSIHDLQLAIQKAEVLKPYSEDVYNDYKKQLEQAVSQKKGVIFSKQAIFADMLDELAPEKVQLLDDIIVIFGEGNEAEQIRQQRVQYVASLLDRAKQAFLDKQYKQSFKWLALLATIESNYPGSNELRQQLASAELEQQLWDALEKGQTDKAYEILKQLMVPDYIATHPDVIPIAEDMIQFYVAQGDAAVKKSNLDAAYPSYSKAHALRMVIGRKDTSPGEVQFIERVNKRLQTYVNESAYLPAYGCLMVIAELQPEHPAIAKFEPVITEAVLLQARIKIIEGTFTAENAVSVNGSDLLAAIKSTLAKVANGKVQWIDAHMAEQEFQPTDIIKQPNQGSYFVLATHTQHANIVVRDHEDQDIKHVVTHNDVRQNPEYQSWLSLDEKVRKGIVAPEETIISPVEEDIVVTKNIHEKKASVVIDFRFADAVNAKVLVTKVVEQEKSYRSENIAAVNAGFFVQPEVKGVEYQDAEIYQELVSLAAEAIVKQVVDEVVQLQAAYIQKADQAVVMEDFNVATTYYAYSFALQGKSGQLDQELLEKLRFYSLRWQ